MTSRRPVSLVIPTLNAGPLLGEVLAGLDRQEGGMELERIAVDSGSSDGTVDRLRAGGFAVHSIPRRTFNHGATRDLAIVRARGEVVVLLTQDAVPADPSWLRRLLEPYDDSRVAGVYCRQVPRADCNPILAARLRNWSAGKESPIVQEVSSPAALEALPPLERLARCAFDNVASSVRRSVWENLPFGPRPFGEDLAWGKRAVLAGWRIVFQPRSVVVHSHNRSPWAEARRLYCDHQNLNDLFGISLIPTLEGARRAAREQREKHLRLLADLPPEVSRPWIPWAKRYAFGEAFGIFLGARSAEWRRRRAWWFPLLDALLRRGI
ncbi:MAG: glycosyltransferase [Planctomycetes bacterium]|nr:glycosyltransferase [Planctomycetota bacterium]